MKLRKRMNKNKIEDFINRSIDDQKKEPLKELNLEVKSKRDLYQTPNPKMAQGSLLRKPLTINLKENEWNTIDEHTKQLGISKIDWLRHAIFSLIEKEQNQE